MDELKLRDTFTGNSEGALHPDRGAKAADLFKALGDPTRLKMLYLTATYGQLCCVDFSEALGISAPTVTHHMKRLSAAGLVNRSKRGRWAFYEINPTEFDRVRDLIEAL